jgi:hypothetical protein
MQPSVAAEETETLTDAIILDGLSDDQNAVHESILVKSVVANVCHNDSFRKLSGLAHGDCIAISEIEVQQCWRILNPLLPDFGFGTPSFRESQDQEQLLSSLAVMEKCVQASIFLRSDEPTRTTGVEPDQTD